MLSRGRRDRLTIMAEILIAAKSGTVKTQIMYRADLSFAQLEEYISFLRDTQLLVVNTEDGRTVYRRTSKGAKYLEAFAGIRGLLKKTDEPGSVRAPPYWSKIE